MGSGAAADAAAAAARLEDWQAQADEVQALAAIYGDDFRLLGAAGVEGVQGGAAEGAAAVAARGGSSTLSPEALADAPPPPHDWALDCCLAVTVAPPAGRLELLLPPQQEGEEAAVQKQQQQRQAEGSEEQQAGGGSGEGADAAPADGEVHPAATSGGEGEGGGSGSARYNVQHLPPLVLQLRLGPGYPSRHPPEAALSALWLSRRQARALEGALLRQCAEAGGCSGGPVVYAWADWLAGEALAHLGAAVQLQLEGDGEAGEEGGEGAGEEAAAATEAEGEQQQGEAAERGGDPSGSAAAAAEAGGEQRAELEGRLFALLRCAALLQRPCARRGGCALLVPPGHAPPCSPPTPSHPHPPPTHPPTHPQVQRLSRASGLPGRGAHVWGVPGGEAGARLLPPGLRAPLLLRRVHGGAGEAARAGGHAGRAALPPAGVRRRAGACPPGAPAASRGVCAVGGADAAAHPGHHARWGGWMGGGWGARGGGGCS